MPVGAEPTQGPDAGRGASYFRGTVEHRAMVGTSDPVRLGIVGLGFMGRTHASNAETLGHTVVAGADIAADASEGFAETHDVSVYEDFESMYDREPLDAVVVSTPNAAHEPAVVGALERGYHVLCEKPLAHDLESAERMAAAAAEADGFCTVNFHNRFSAGVAAFKASQAAGRFGELTHVQADFVRRRGIPGGSWFTDRDLSGGGAVIDIGVHAIDFALHLLDFPPLESVFAVTRTQFGHRADYVTPQGRFPAPDAGAFDVEDSATALIRGADDRTISLEVAWAANQPPSNEFVARGTDAGARLELGGDDLTVFEVATDGTDQVVESTTAGGSLEHAGWKGSDERFLDAASRDEAPELNTVDQALSVQRVVDGIYRSAAAGWSVELGDGGRR